jgi:hypothetical protein
MFVVMLCEVSNEREIEFGTSHLAAELASALSAMRDQRFAIVRMFGESKERGGELRG